LEIQLVKCEKRKIISMSNISSILPKSFEWCDIPAGDVTIYPDRIDRVKSYLKQQTVFTVPAFKIAKDLVTNAQYDLFITHADGYRNLAWWDFSDDAKNWRMNNTEPLKIGLVGDDKPRTNVAWYDAVAFCQWISAMSGEAMTLPTEPQWQRFVHYDMWDLYFWGVVSEVDDVESVASMSDWCLTTYKTGHTDLLGTDDRVVKHGYRYVSDQAGFPVISCDGVHPYLGYQFIGFRLVMNT
jgi:hypothetical protein